MSWPYVAYHLKVTLQRNQQTYFNTKMHLLGDRLAGKQHTRNPFGEYIEPGGGVADGSDAAYWHEKYSRNGHSEEKQPDWCL